MHAADCPSNPWMPPWESSTLPHITPTPTQTHLSCRRLQKSRVEGTHGVENLHHGLDTAFLSFCQQCQKKTVFHRLPQNGETCKAVMKFVVAFVIGSTTEQHNRFVFNLFFSVMMPHCTSFVHILCAELIWVKHQVSGMTGKRDVSSHLRDKFAAPHHCHSVICDFT